MADEKINVTLTTGGGDKVDAASSVLDNVIVAGDIPGDVPWKTAFSMLQAAIRDGTKEITVTVNGEELSASPDTVMTQMLSLYGQAALEAGVGMYMDANHEAGGVGRYPGNLLEDKTLFPRVPSLAAKSTSVIIGGQREKSLLPQDKTILVPDKPWPVVIAELQEAIKRGDKTATVAGVTDDPMTLLLICMEQRNAQMEATTVMLRTICAELDGYRKRGIANLTPKDRLHIQGLLDRGKALQLEAAGLSDDIKEIDALGFRIDDIAAQLNGAASAKSPDMVGALKQPVFSDKLPIDENGVRQQRLKDILKPGLSPVTTIIDIAAKAFPQLVDMFYPRQYENVGGYHSPRHCCLLLANVVAECLRYGFHNSPTAYRLLMPGLKNMVDKRMPLFFISPTLLEAIKQTTFASDINWEEMRLPYESGAFILPRGGFEHPTDGEVSMIVWSRTEANSEYAPPVKSLPICKTKHAGFALVGLCPEQPIWYQLALNAKFDSTLKLGNMFHLEEGQAFPTVKKSAPALDEDVSAVDAEFLEQMAVIAFGTFLAMQARPELVDAAKMLKSVPAKGDKPRREFWAPNIIGARYKLKREVPKAVKGLPFQFQPESGAVPPQGRCIGTHASPRLHWRRGHIRQQPYGPGRKEKKTIWIEPCLIGAIEE